MGGKEERAGGRKRGGKSERKGGRGSLEKRRREVAHTKYL